MSAATGARPAIAICAMVPSRLTTLPSVSLACGLSMNGRGEMSRTGGCGANCGIGGVGLGVAYRSAAGATTSRCTRASSARAAPSSCCASATGGPKMARICLMFSAYCCSSECHDLRRLGSFGVSAGAVAAGGGARSGCQRALAPSRGGGRAPGWPAGSLDSSRRPAGPRDCRRDRPRSPRPRPLRARPRASPARTAPACRARAGRCRRPPAPSCCCPECPRARSRPAPSPWRPCSTGGPAPPARAARARPASPRCPPGSTAAPRRARARRLLRRLLRALHELFCWPARIMPSMPANAPSPCVPRRSNGSACEA